MSAATPAITSAQKRITVTVTASHAHPVMSLPHQYIIGISSLRGADFRWDDPALCGHTGSEDEVPSDAPQDLAAAPPFRSPGRRREATYGLGRRDSCSRSHAVSRRRAPPLLERADPDVAEVENDAVGIRLTQTGTAVVTDHSVRRSRADPNSAEVVH